MSEAHKLWIEALPGAQVIPPPRDRTPSSSCHVQFACLVRVRTPDEIDDSKWGFNRGALLVEALSRQKLFLESQHPAIEPGEPDTSGCRTLALRAINLPSDGRIQLALIGKVCAADLPAATAEAELYWQELRSTFPHDYELLPATDRESFQRLAGWRLLQQANQPGAFAEVQRAEQIISTGQQRFYFLGQWRGSDLANEQIWRALAGAQHSLVLDILLRPAVLTEFELVALNEIAKVTRTIADSGDLITVQPYARAASEYYTRLTNALRRPYIMQVRLAGPHGIPAYIPRAIGFALIHNGQDEAELPGFQIVAPCNSQELEQWRGQLIWMEPEISPETARDQRFARLRKMFSAHDAHIAFRLPFPPKHGLFGVTFMQE